MIEPGEELLTVAEAAEMARVSIYTIWRAIRAKRLEGSKLTKEWRTSREAIHRWFANTANTPPERPKVARRKHLEAVRAELRRKGL